MGGANLGKIKFQKYFFPRGNEGTGKDLFSASLDVPSVLRTLVTSKGTLSNV
jgi:hypothetical protein